MAKQHLHKTEILEITDYKLLTEEYIFELILSGRLKDYTLINLIQVPTGFTELDFENLANVVSKYNLKGIKINWRPHLNCSFSFSF